MYEGRRVERGPFAELVETIPESVVGSLSLQKKKRVRLQGKAIKQLNEQIHERDGGRCIFCGAWVSRAEKWHHWPFGSEKEDIPEKGVTACGSCHADAHIHNVIEMARRCAEYLGEFYPHLMEYYWRHVKGA